MILQFLCLFTCEYLSFITFVRIYRLFLLQTCTHYQTFCQKHHVTTANVAVEPQISIFYIKTRSFKNATKVEMREK